jgi:hypothetical protein
MKRFLVLVAVAFGAVALYAVTAPAGERAVTPGQITAINKKIANLQKQVNTINNCLKKHVVAMTEYNGFQYQQSGGTVVTTTAIATTDQGDTVQFYVLSTSASCAQTLGIAASGRAAPRPATR